MSNTAATSQRPVRNLQETPLLRVSRLRRAVPGPFKGHPSEVRLAVESGAGPQQLLLVPDRSPYGPRYLAVCECGLRTPLLRFDIATGLWKCWKCCNLRSISDRYGNSRAFRQTVRPLLNLMRAYKRLRPSEQKRRWSEFRQYETDILRDIDAEVGETLARSRACIEALEARGRGSEPAEPEESSGGPRDRLGNDGPPRPAGQVADAGTGGRT